MLGAERVLLTTSCTHALELALLALGIGPGREVICPSFTFVSTANAILRVGARPVFAEIEERTLGLDAGRRRRARHPKTAALLPVHYAGVAPDMEALLALAGSQRPARDRGRRPGPGRHLARAGPSPPWATCGCLSFHETKNITCGEGGALVVGDAALAARAEIIREKGTNRSAFLRGEVDKYTWVAEGSSYILSDVLAAILDAQLDRFDRDPGPPPARESRATRRSSPTGRARGACACTESLPERTPNHHIFLLLFPDERSRDACHGPPEEAGRPGHVPLRAPALLALRPDPGADGLELPVTDRVARTLLRLPLHPLLTEEDVDRVVAAVRSFPA